MFHRSDFTRLAKQLGSITGKFILSINDTPEIRQIFAAFPFDEVETNYTIAGAGAQVAKELIVRTAAR